jgi:flagellar basal body L-ring protein FlgH
VKYKMRKLLALFVAMLFATSMIVAAGCAKKEEPAKPAVEQAKPAEPTEPAKAPEAEKKAEEAKPAEKAPAAEKK